MTQPSTPCKRPGRTATVPAGFLRRLMQPLPSWQETLFGSLAWATAITLCILAALRRINGWIDGDLGIVAAIYFTGAILAFAPAAFLARLLTAGKRWETRFAGAFVCLAAVTIGVTSLIYSLEHIRHMIDWRDITNLVQVVFAVIASEAGFAALGVRLYAPEGLLALVVASFWLARTR